MYSGRWCQSLFFILQVATRFMYTYELRYDQKSRYLSYHDGLSPWGISDSLPQHLWSGEQSYFLVDESWFHVLSFSHDVDNTLDDKAYSAGDFYALCDEKYNYYLTQLDQFPAKQLGFFVDNITVNNKPSEFLLWQRGEIAFHLQLFFLQHSISDQVQRLRSHDSLLVVPSSLATIHYVKSTLWHNRFVLLYLYDDFAKLVYVKDGTYQRVETINLGKRKLIGMIQEAWLTELFHTIESGDGLQTHLIQSLEEVYLFYIRQLIERISGISEECDKLLLVGGGLSYPFFTQLFHREFSQKLSAFLIPLHLWFDDNFHGNSAMTDLLCFNHFHAYFQKNYHQVAT